MCEQRHYSISLAHVSVKLNGINILDDISFTLPEDGHLAIFGPSGSGKTVLAKLLSGQIYHQGKVELNHSSKKYPPNIIYIPSVHVFKNRSNVTDFYYQQRFNTSDAEDANTLKEELAAKLSEEQMNHWLKKFDLLHRLNTPMIQLSNGELKKIQLIHYLSQSPDLLILDNVFTGLDVNSRKKLHVIINELAANGTTIILITNHHELPACITHFAELDNGSLKNFDVIERLGYMNHSSTIKFKDQYPTFKKAYHIGPLISMQNVCIKYGQQFILNNITWKVNNGECWQVKGHNGAGKSTLLSLITGDNPQAYSQNIHLFGRKRGSGESIWDIKKKIGFVSPELQLHFDKSATVWQTIGSGFFDTIGLFKKPTEDQQHRIAEWLDYFCLTDKSNTHFSSLSTSEQRLILIARALVKDPLILALDEPFQGLDEQQSRQILQLLDTIHQQTSISILFISHYEDELPACIQHVIELQKGEATIYRRKLSGHKNLMNKMQTSGVN